MNPLQSLIAAGTKLYLDSVAPEEVAKNLSWGAVGATSNPAIVSEIILKGAMDAEIERCVQDGLGVEQMAWMLTDQLVTAAEKAFLPTWRQSKGNAGWVSFELDPLLEDPGLEMSLEERSRRYVELGLQWAAGHPNRMIKVPATEAGLLALEDLAAAGITLNVTLIFTMEQYLQARDAVWRGAQRRASLDTFKSVYSIFVSRIDLYTDEEVPTLSAATQGQVGIVNAKRIWEANRRFWQSHSTPLQQEIIFASTGTKKPADPPWKYVQALAGSDIQTNPPQTNQAVADCQQTFRATLTDPIAESLWAEIQAKVDFAKMQQTLMAQGVDKFIKPQRALLALLQQRRQSLVGSK